jgi:hypothetical protein
MEQFSKCVITLKWGFYVLPKTNFIFSIHASGYNLKGLKKLNHPVLFSASSML